MQKNLEMRIDQPSVLRNEWRGQTNDHQGLPVVVIENKYCRAVIAYQGAQVLEFQRWGHAPLLWLSEQSHFLPKRAIRGGIPLCFPWFGKHLTDPSSLSHGFARNLPWTLDQVTETENEHLMVFSLEDNIETWAMWPNHFKAKLEIRLGLSLSFKFSVSNTGVQPFDFTFAFHSYFLVEDAKNTQIIGLENTKFYDQLEPELGFDQVEDMPIRMRHETDRIYQNGLGLYEIVQDHSSQRSIIQTPDCHSVIVWNPWIEKTALHLDDMYANAWQDMLCVECGRTELNTVALDAGQKVSFNMTLSSTI